MRFKAGVLFIGIIMLLAGTIASQSIVTLKDKRSLADTKVYGGEIVAPSICPVDSTWISFEVHRKEEIRLYIYNTVTLDTQRIRFPSDELFSGMESATEVDRNIAWMPTLGNDDHIWLAFIGNTISEGRLYLYDVNRGEYYKLCKNMLDSAGTAVMSSPSWSPDGKCLTYTSTLYNDKDIFIIRNMEFVLKDPDHYSFATWHKLLIKGEGDQFGPVWNPIVGSGLIAYTNFNPDNDRLEVRIRDSKIEEDLEQSYRFISIPESMGSIGPSWSPGGDKLGFYLYDLDKNQQDNQPDSSGNYYEVALGNIIPDSDEDTFIVTIQQGGRSNDRSLLKIAPNNSPFRGPAWLSTNKDILVPEYDEYAKNPFRILNTLEWSFGSPRRYWRESLSEVFDFPSDACVMGNNLIFTYLASQQRNLMYSRLKINASAYNSDTLEIHGGRLNWWKRYMEGKPPCDWKCWLNQPLIGSGDYIINRPWAIGTIIIGMIIILWPSPSPLPLTSKRDWDPPNLPDPDEETSAKITIGIGGGK